MFPLLYNPYFLAGWLSWIIIGTLIILQSNNLPKYSISMVFWLTLIFTIYPPLIEESLFRHTLPYYFGDYAYFKVINAILFGLMHTINLTINPNIKIITCQVIFSTFMGWHFVNLNSFEDSLCMHMLVNFVNLLITTSIIKIIEMRRKKNIIKNDFGSEKILMKCYTIKKSSSCGNIRGKNEPSDRKFVEVDNDLLLSFDKFDNIQDTRIRV